MNQLVLLAETLAPTRDLGFIQGVLLLAVFAMLARSFALEIRRRKCSARRVLILGTGPMAARLIEEIESSPDPRCVVAGVVGDRPSGSIPWLGPVEQLTEIVDRVRPAHIVVALADRRGHFPLKPLLESRSRGVTVEDALEFYERLTGKIAIEALNPSSLILSNGFRRRGATRLLARIISVVFAAVGLVLAAPLLAAIAIAVTLDSRGPVLFIQERAGRYGRPFGLLKFRTMHPCDQRPSEWVLDNCDRITRVGKWLRRFRLDELPQFVNVLRGEMNLIGPRPHPTSNHKIFVEHIAYYGLRSSLRPGVTGWAQVRYGYANNLEEETEKMRYDLYYIKNRSLWLDLRILLETVGIMLGGRGAAKAGRPSPIQTGVAWRSVPRTAGKAPAWHKLTGSSPAETSAAPQ